MNTGCAPENFGASFNFIQPCTIFEEYKLRLGQERELTYFMASRLALYLLGKTDEYRLRLWQTKKAAFLFAFLLALYLNITLILITL